jgi:hypothetical protein
MGPESFMLLRLVERTASGLSAERLQSSASLWQQEE